jgi:hypothetical protein
VLSDFFSLGFSLVFLKKPKIPFFSSFKTSGLPPSENFSLVEVFVEAR